MQFFRVFCVVAMIVILSPTTANDCIFCDDFVEMNDDYAACFLENYDALLEYFETDNAPSAELNLAFCSGFNADRDRGGVGQIRAFPKAEDIKAVYTLDQVRAECLHEIVSAHIGSLSPVSSFDLYEECDI